MERMFSFLVTVVVVAFCFAIKLLNVDNETDAENLSAVDIADNNLVFKSAPIFSRPRHSRSTLERDTIFSLDKDAYFTLNGGLNPLGKHNIG